MWVIVWCRWVMKLAHRWGLFARKCSRERVGLIESWKVLHWVHCTFCVAALCFLCAEVALWLHRVCVQPLVRLVAVGVGCLVVCVCRVK